MNRSEIIISESVLSSFLAGWNASFEKIKPVRDSKYIREWYDKGYGHGIRTNGNLQESEAWKDYMIAMNKK